MNLYIQTDNWCYAREDNALYFKLYGLKGQNIDAFYNWYAGQDHWVFSVRDDRLVALNFDDAEEQLEVMDEAYNHFLAYDNYDNDI
jgi:hypothetical protein